MIVISNISIRLIESNMMIFMFEFRYYNRLFDSMFS